MMSMPDDVSALQLVLGGDPALLAIVRLSLIVSLSAVFFAALIGVPLGALIALTRFPGRDGVIVTLNAMMGSRDRPLSSGRDRMGAARIF
jgi:tungstate transport system permease protein